jgi:hypothetical protein
VRNTVQTIPNKAILLFLNFNSMLSARHHNSGSTIMFNAELTVDQESVQRNVKNLGYVPV